MRLATFISNLIGHDFETEIKEILQNKPPISFLWKNSTNTTNIAFPGSVVAVFMFFERAFDFFLE